MKREIVEIAAWLRDENDDVTLESLSAPETELLHGREDVSLLAELSELIASDLLSD